MKSQDPILPLSLLAALLAALAAAFGLAWPDGAPGPAETLSVHEKTVRLMARGLYRHDAVFFGVGFLGQDLVTLLLAAPLLLLAALRARNGVGPWVLWRTAVLAYLLYVYASMALGAAYNPLFLLYVAAYATSLFALWLSGAELAGAIDRALARGTPALPRRGAMWLLAVSGIFTGLVWTLPLLLALRDGTPPPLLEHRTTMVTDALDLGIILPGTLVAAWLVRSGRPLGWSLAAGLLGVLVMLLPNILAATVAQLLAGVRFTVPEILGPISGFLVFGALGIRVLLLTARALSGEPLPD